MGVITADMPSRVVYTKKLTKYLISFYFRTSQNYLNSATSAVFY